MKTGFEFSMYWFPRLSDRVAHDKILILYHFPRPPKLKKLVQDVNYCEKIGEIPLTQLFAMGPAPKVPRNN